jgi:SAM-dependent methyltransferase
MHTQTKCQSCGANGMAVFYEVRGVPIHSCLLLPSREEALRFPRRDLALGFCATCGFIANVIFDPQVMNYSAAYEEQQSFSPRFNVFAEGLAKHLVEKYHLRNKNVVEIGCGKGDFLALLCQLGYNRGVGVDPSYVPGRLPSPAADRVTFIADFYSERYAYLAGDLVCCRHTLEHIERTREFVETIGRTLGERSQTVIFFEVPDVTRVLQEGAFWDIYYEHCSYFTLASLGRLFYACGFELLDVGKAFDGQYLLLEARPRNGTAARPVAETDLEQEARDVTCFAANYRRRLKEWQDRLSVLRSKSQRAAIWGSSSKCVAFLSALELPDDTECVVVDINPHRHGKYLPGSGKAILPPSALRDYQPDLVIPMNPIYSSEIRQDLDRMGLQPEVIAV